MVSSEEQKSRSEEESKCGAHVCVRTYTCTDQSTIFTVVKREIRYIKNPSVDDEHILVSALHNTAVSPTCVAGELDTSRECANTTSCTVLRVLVG